MVWLTLNSRRPVFMQSAYVKEGTLTNFTLIDLFSIGPMIAPVKNLLVLGMAAGASVRQYQQFFPDVKIDAVEIDAKLIEIAHERFGVSENANLKIFAADARPFLAKSDTKYDAVEIDLFQGSPYIPFYTATEEFFQSVLAHLSERGLLMMNVMAPGKQEILAPMLATIKTVFPSVYTISVNNNFLVLATTQKSNLEEIKKTIADTQTQSSPELKSASGYALDFLKEYQADKKTPVFTDDWAPVELLTYRMLKSARL
jgi:spermidine synthase